MSRTYFGQAGHFVGAASCRFHLHTHTNGYCVSTVGEWFPRGADKLEFVGHMRTYETMVFKLDADGETTGSDLSLVGYLDRDEANTGHERALVAIEARKEPA